MRTCNNFFKGLFSLRCHCFPRDNNLCIFVSVRLSARALTSLLRWHHDQVVIGNIYIINTLGLWDIRCWGVCWCPRARGVWDCVWWAVLQGAIRGLQGDELLYLFSKQLVIFVANSYEFPCSGCPGAAVWPRSFLPRPAILSAKMQECGQEGV